VFLVILTIATACASTPIDVSPANPQHRCEYSNVGGRRMWEHVNVVGNDGTFLTIEYPNREREMSGDRRGQFQQKKVWIEANAIGPCKEDLFTPTAPPAEFGSEHRQ